jgi:predicted metal-dependent peptidase
MDLMQKARAQIAIKHIFFASLVLSTKCIADPTIPTACTDMREIRYNPTFIESLGDTKLVMFVMAHEVMHIALKHGLRRGHRHPVGWNIAADYAINLQLKKAGFTIWEHAYIDERFDGMSTEAIYDLLRQEANEGGGGKGGQGGKPGKGAPNGGFGESDPSKMGGDLVEPDDMTSEERAAVEQRIGQQVAQAAAMARMQGKMPADLARLVDGVLNPPLPWQQMLAEFMSQACTAVDETWNRRNRRFADIYLPGRYSETMGEVVVIGDTSGSINNQVFAQTGAELDGIMHQVRPERVRVIWADAAECSAEETFEAGEPIVLNPKGGGGTDMRKPMKFVERYDPLVVILITDGLTPWPSVEPDYPLIVLCTTEVEVPVGRVVRWNQGD